MSDIEKVEAQIASVEEAIKEAERQIEQAGKRDLTNLSTEEKEELREEKKQLREEKKQLREKEKQLREKEKQLRDKEILLLKQSSDRQTNGLEAGLDALRVSYQPTRYVALTLEAAVAKVQELEREPLPRPTLKFVSIQEFTSRDDLKSSDEKIPVLSWGDGRERQQVLDLRFQKISHSSEVFDGISKFFPKPGVTVVLGVSGCGKTSSTFALGQVDYCIFLDAPANGSLGSTDLRYLLEEDIRDLCKLHSDIHVPTANHYVRALVAARSLYLLTLMRGSNPPTPTDWLLMQLNLVPGCSAPHFAIFLSIYEILKQQRGVFLGSIFEELKRILKKSGKALFLVLDEAQVLTTPDENFPRNDASYPKQLSQSRYRTPLSVLVEALLGTNMALVCAGTKLSLPDLALVQSGASKVGETELIQVSSFTTFPFFTAKEAIDCVRELVPVELGPIGDKLTGRARIWSSFADCLLHRLKEQKGTSTEVIVEQCRKDFFAFHIYATQSASPLTSSCRSFRKHFDKHLAACTPRVSPGSKVTLHSELSELVTASLLNLGTPREVHPVEADWVSGGICFLHQIKQESKTSESVRDTYVMSCKEPLVLDAIVARMGVQCVIDSICGTLATTKSLLGSKDVSKGILFQHLTIAQLLQHAHSGATIGELLLRWTGTGSDPAIESSLRHLPWLSSLMEKPMEFKHATRDIRGDDVTNLIAAGDTHTILVLPNAARGEYFGMLSSSVGLVAECKFYSKTDTKAFEDNEKSTNLSNLFCLKDGAVNPGYVAQQKAVAAAAERLSGSIRLVFSISETKNLHKPQLRVQVIQNISRWDLIITFTRSTMPDFFGDGITRLLESFYSKPELK